jgi:hypothetical protein
LKIRELWRLSNIVYREISFQSVYSLRSGGLLPRRGETSIKQLVKSAQTNTLLSKILTSVFTGAFAFIAFYQPSFTSSVNVQSQTSAIIGTVTAFLSSVLFIIVFMGLQVSTSFISSKAVEILSPLPLSRRDVSNIVFVCFLRIFDLPLIVSLVAFVSAYMLLIGSVLGGLAAFISVLVTESFAVSASIALSRFFYSRVSGAGGRSGWKSLMRAIFMIVWVLPTVGIYLVLSYAFQIVQSFAALTRLLSSFANFLALVYPFSFGILISSATSLSGVDAVTLGFAIVSFFFYVLAAYYCLRWVTRTVRKLGAGQVTSVLREIVKDTMIRTASPWLGIIRKDLRVASRAPSYASLFLLPVVQTIVLASSFSSFDNVGLENALGILVGMSTLTLIIAPILFSIEGLSSSYSRTLPLRRRTLIGAKAFLATLTYVIALIVLFIVGLFVARDFSVLLIFGGTYMFSIAAGNMTELAIMANKFWKEGFAIGNIYSRLSTYIVVVLPGIAVIMMPVIGTLTAYFFNESLVLPVFGVISIMEFALAGLFIFLGEK